MESSLFVILICTGVLLALAELLLPTHGVLFALGLAGIVIGVVLAFGVGPTTGLVTLAAVVIALPIVFVLAGHYWLYSPMGRRFQLVRPLDDGSTGGPGFDPSLEKLRGRIGRALSALRPAGVVDFDGRRVDTVTEGMMVDPGQYVRCIDVQAGKVIVRPIDKPDLGDLETMVFR